MTESATETSTTATTTETATVTDETAELGDAGKKALDAMKSKWKAAEAKAKANEEAATRLEQLEAASASETEKAVAAARKEGETAATQRVNTVLIKAEARAIAAELGFRDPLDALGQVSLADISVTDDGDVDSEAIKTELEDLAKRKDYLLKPKADTSASDAGIGTTGAVANDGSPQSLIRAGLAQSSKK